MSQVQKAATLVAFTIAALVGFLLLPIAHAILWLTFLVVSFPVAVAFITATTGGARFSPSQLIEIYAESVRALPKLLKLTRDEEGRKE
jgi:hypothetical protein